MPNPAADGIIDTHAAQAITRVAIPLRLRISAILWEAVSYRF